MILIKDQEEGWEIKVALCNSIYRHLKRGGTVKIEFDKQGHIIIAEKGKN